METSTSPRTSLSTTVRVTRIVWLTMLASIVILAAVTEISTQTIQPMPKRFFDVIAGLCVAIVIAKSVVRRVYFVQGEYLLATDRTDLQALKRWQTGHIYCFALSEAVAMFGLVLRGGSTLREVAPFYLAGFVLMLSSRPKTPPENG